MASGRRAGARTRASGRVAPVRGARWDGDGARWTASARGDGEDAADCTRRARRVRGARAGERGGAVLYEL